VKVLTVHVESDVSGQGADHVVVGCLAREHRIEMTPLKILQPQQVLDTAFGQCFVRIVDLNALSPPRDPRRWTTCKATGSALLNAHSFFAGLYTVYFQDKSFGHSFNLTNRNLVSSVK